jgi:isoleucyl-tRNA synthetase
MKREADLIDVWFDSGSMPYAQWHYPFENKDKIDANKDFLEISLLKVDGSDSWMVLYATCDCDFSFDKVAYKNVVSNGLVLDKTDKNV